MSIYRPQRKSFWVFALLREKIYLVFLKFNICPVGDGLTRNALHKHVLQNGCEWDAVFRNKRLLLRCTRCSVQRLIAGDNNLKNPLCFCYLYNTICIKCARNRSCLKLYDFYAFRINKNHFEAIRIIFA